MTASVSVDRTRISGLLCVVFGLARAEDGSWTSPVVLGTLAAGVVILAGFIAHQGTARWPLLPLGILRDRNRAAAYINRFAAATGNYTVIFFLTFILQENLHLSPVWSGLGVVPMMIGIIVLRRRRGHLLDPHPGPQLPG